ncbi:MAG: methyltransferase [Myxococcota bacterium]
MTNAARPKRTKVARRAATASSADPSGRGGATKRPRRSTPPPHAQMLALLTGHWVAQMLFAFVKLGLPDRLGTKALAPDDLADALGANAGHLRRLLRALASCGVVEEGARGRFRLTPLGRTLRSGPGSLRDFALMIVAPYNTRAWEKLADAVTLGRPGFDLAFGRPVFEYLAAHPDDDRQFSASMASISAGESDAIARAYPWRRHARIVDVGGAHGHLLAAILRRHPRVRGVLYDQPQVVAGAEASGFLGEPRLRERSEIRGGSFFEAVPTGADAYFMKYILHDWDDPRAERILALCRDAMAPGGRVLVIDRVIAAGNAPDWSKWLDINMMVGPGGLERTRAEFQALFARTGLRLVKVHATKSPLSILEAERG